MSHPELTCDLCTAVLYVDWVEVTAMGDVEPRYVPGRTRCPTVGCGSTCPICHEAVGEIHSGACAPIVLAKVDDPTRVSREDCRAVVR